MTAPNGNLGQKWEEYAKQLAKNSWSAAQIADAKQQFMATQGAYTPIANKPGQTTGTNPTPEQAGATVAYAAGLGGFPTGAWSPTGSGGSFPTKGTIPVPAPRPSPGAGPDYSGKAVLARSKGMWTKASAPAEIVSAPPDTRLDDLLAQLNASQQELYSGAPGGFSGPTADFKRNDFSQQANDLAAKNYAPQYEALKLAQGNAQANYGRSDTITKGLYDNLQADIKQGADKTAADYAARNTQRQAQGATAQQNISDIYAGVQDNQTDVLKKLGIEAAAPATMAPLASDSAWQQSNAANTTQQQADYNTNVGGNSVDYQNNVANAEGTQGVVRREQLLNDLSNRLSGLDQQRLGITSQQSLSAMDLSNRLSDNDMGLQKDNYNANYAAARDAYGSEVEQYKSSVQQKQSGNDALIQAYNMRMEQEDRGIAAQDRDHKYAMDEFDVGNTLAKAQAEAAAAASKSGVVPWEQLDVYGQLSTQLGRDYRVPPDNAAKIIKTVNDLAIDPNNRIDLSTMLSNARMANPGENQSAVDAAVMALWKSMKAPGA